MSPDRPGRVPFAESGTSATTGTGRVRRYAGLAGVARVRALPNADRAGTVSRVAGGVADERDLRIATASLAWVGTLAVLLASPAGAATHLGASGEVLVRTMPFALPVVAGVSSAVVSRRS